MACEPPLAEEMLEYLVELDRQELNVFFAFEQPELKPEIDEQLLRLIERISHERAGLLEDIFEGWRNRIADSHIPRKHPAKAV